MQQPEDATMLPKWIMDKLEERKVYYAGRDEVMRFDRALLQQRYRQEIRGTASIQSAEPRNAVRLGLDIMTRRDLRFQVTISDQDAEEQDKVNDLERFAMGLWRATERQYRQMGKRGFLRDLDWYILMGGYAVLPLVQDIPQEGTRFSARVLDPINVYADYDDNGMCWVAHEYWTTMKAVRPRYASKSGWDMDAITEKSDKDLVRVVDCWWIDPIKDDEEKLGVYNALMVAGAMVKPATYEKQFGRKLPLQFGPSSGMPSDNPLNDNNTIMGTTGGPPIYNGDNLNQASATQWGSILADARISYADLDSLLSYSAEIVRRNALGRYVQRTRNAAPRIAPNQFRNVELITMNQGEDIIPVPPPSSPAQINELLQYLQGSIQRSTLSFTAFGTLGIEISGVTLDSLNNATQSVLSPFISASQYVISEMILSYTNQFKDGGFKPVSLEVRDRRGEDVSQRWFLQDYKRQDIPKTALLTVQQSLALPDTTLARLNAARTAVGDNRQLMSEQGIDEHLIPDMVPDYQVNQEQMSADKVRNSPQVTAFDTVEGLRKMADDAQSRGDRDMAMMALTLMQSTLQQFQQQFAGEQQAVAGIDRQREAQAGASITEPSPDQSPPEASGVRPEAVDQDRLAGNNALRDLTQRRSASVNGTR